MARKGARGFTLIEISIVLVIIGLLAGGIMVGRVLIRAAEMRAVHQQFTKYVTAVHTFRSKYNCMPGDCKQAEDIFGRDPGGCPPPPGSKPNHWACKGNGDEKLQELEQLEAWRNLGAAGLIEGSFSGTSLLDFGVSTDSLFWFGMKAGYNCPMLLSESACWVWNNNSVDLSGIPVSAVAGNYGNTVLSMFPVGFVTSDLLAMPSIIAPAYAIGVTPGNVSWIFTPSEALSYDTKFDDGDPVRGTVMAELLPPDLEVSTPCIVEMSPGAWRYDLSQSGLICGFFYRTGF